METFHNPDRFIADLRQILSQGRKRIGLLVGAGAPMAIRVGQNNRLDSSGSALIPGVDELTKVVIASIDAKQSEVAKKIVTDLEGPSNIEAVLSRVRLLEQALGKSSLNGLTGVEYGILGATLCKEIGRIVGATLPKEPNAYTELVAWVSGTVRSHAIEIFTTNYDLLFEEAFERARAPYFDGFSGGSSPFFDPVTVAGDDLPARWSRLWKLHGSIGWALEGGSVVRSGGRAATQLVYPDHLKYDLTKKQPYASLFERLKDFLLTPDTLLLTIGFSFRDAHISAVIDEALAMNANAAVIAFQYEPLVDEVFSCQLAYDRPNLSVYAADGAVVSGVKGKWRLGELPKNWDDVRASFWGAQGFMLGDFVQFTRFCALAQASEITYSLVPNAGPAEGPAK